VRVLKTQASAPEAGRRLRQSRLLVKGRGVMTGVAETSQNIPGHLQRDAVMA